MKEPDLAQQLCEALKTDSGAALSIMQKRSGLLRRIIGSGSDFRWVALRHVCTFEKPDLVKLVQEHDEIRKVLDGASGDECHDKLRISGLRERYRCLLLDEALIAAAQNADDEQAKRLLEMGADANAQGQSGQTPLTTAAYCGYGAGVIRMLLEHGAAKDGTEANGSTALEIAKKCGHTENMLVLERHI
jgi:ankyrin repeat protein